MTKGDALRLFLAGALLGAAALISPKVLVLIMLFGIALYMQGKMKRFIKTFPVFLTRILLVLAPWTARNYRCFGELILTTSNGGINLYIGNNPGSTGGYYPLDEEFHPDLLAYQSGEWIGEAAKYIRTHPWRTIGRSFKKGLLFWNPHYGDQVVLLLAFVVGWIRIKGKGVRPGSPGLFWIALYPFMFMAVHMIFFVQPRYFLPALPAVSVIAGAGVGGWKPQYMKG